MLVGGGGHSKSVIDAARRMKYFDEIVITDPHMKRGTEVLGCTVRGTDDTLEELYQQGFKYAFIAVGNVNINSSRKTITDKISAIGFRFPVIQDPSAVVSNSAIIGEGSFIGKNVVINADVRIGRHCIINTGAIIEHECNVDDFSHISVGTTLCGEVNVGKNCMIGSRSTVIQCTNIGDTCLVGAGAVVLKNIPDNSTAVGVPARII